MAQFAMRALVFRDGEVRKDDSGVSRPRAAEVLKTLLDDRAFSSESSQDYVQTAGARGS